MELQTPGVYVREVDAGPKPIAAVATSVAAFLGVFPYTPAVDAIAVHVEVDGQPRACRLSPACVALDGQLRDVAEAVDALTGGLSLTPGGVRDLKAWLELRGARPTLSKAGDKVRVALSKGEEGVLVDAALLSVSGRLKGDDAAVAALLAELDPQLPSTPTASDVSAVLAPWGLTVQRLAGSALYDDHSAPAVPVTSRGELERWLRSFYARLAVDLGVASAREGEREEEAADRVFAALGQDAELTERFRAFLSQPSVFRFVAAVTGFFDNGGRKAWVYLRGMIDLEGPITGSDAERTGLHAFDACGDVALVAAPGLTARQQQEVLEHCERRRDRFAVLDGPPVAQGDEPIPASDKGYGALYLPWVTVARPAWLRGEVSLDVPERLRRKTVAWGAGEVPVPPSGHVAGLMARVDGERGVHKAPANEVLRGITGLVQRISHDEQGRFNQRGINVVRDLGDRGIRVWGARTLATASDPSWRYVNVRRLFIMLEQSILAGSAWAVFEPNDRLLWTKLRRDVSAFLLRQWRAGALFGRTADEAFFVHCDEETNPRYAIDAGEVHVRIGVCPVKPAEFVVFSIGQWDGGSSLDE